VSDRQISDSPGPDFPLRKFLDFSMEKGAGTAVAELVLDERHMNPNGVAHGAVCFALMDTAMGGAVVSILDEGVMCATIEMQTRFHRAASSGVLRAEATVVSGGRRVVQLEARTVDGEGRLIASATGSFAVIAPR
jgi:acyl-CoA thioesterase